MQSVSLVELAYELHKVGTSPRLIASRIGRHRATVYRWLRGIGRKGIRKFLRTYLTAKKGRRQPRKTLGLIKLRIYAIRERFHHCCGEKVRYWMERLHGIRIGLSTIYRILNEKYQLRGKWKQNVKRGPVPKAEKPREVVQSDTVDFGCLFAYTSVDICTREAQIHIASRLDSDAGAKALMAQMSHFGFVDMLQRDGGPEFKGKWDEAAKTYCHRIRTARPYKKNEQSYIESFNRTLRKECLGWVKYKVTDLAFVQRKVAEFVQFYNNERPHLSLGMKSPREYLSHLR